MNKKITFSILICAMLSYGTEFTFSIDTVWEVDPYIDSGVPITTHLINLSEDSLFIDSLILMIDTITFPKYEVSWRGKKGIFNVYYDFGNWPNSYPPISTYKEQYLERLMRAAPKDSLKLDRFCLERILKPTQLLPYHNRDSLVPISVNVIFFSEGFKDTLALNGEYNFDLPTSINKNNNAIPYQVIYKNQNTFFYDCLGRKLELREILKIKNNTIAKGIYFTQHKKQIILLNNSMK